MPKYGERQTVVDRYIFAVSIDTTAGVLRSVFNEY